MSVGLSNILVQRKIYQQTTEQTAMKFHKNIYDPPQSMIPDVVDPVSFSAVPPPSKENNCRKYYGRFP